MALGRHTQNRETRNDIDLESEICMTILTHEEAKALKDAATWDMFDLIRAIEHAVIAKLAAGVSVEPVGVVRQLHMVTVRFDTSTTYGCDIPDGEKLYTATAIASARVQALEEAANMCDEEARDATSAKRKRFLSDNGKAVYNGVFAGATNCAVAIRALALGEAK